MATPAIRLFRRLEGLFCVYKPPGVHWKLVRDTIETNILKGQLSSHTTFSPFHHPQNLHLTVSVTSLVFKVSRYDVRQIRLVTLGLYFRCKRHFGPAATRSSILVGTRRRNGNGSDPDGLLGAGAVQTSSGYEWDTFIWPNFTTFYLISNYRAGSK